MDGAPYMIFGSPPDEPTLAGAAACHGRRAATTRRRERLVGRLKAESGYSLVEVMASIVILAVAIIPMVAMFDSGLTAANTSGNYDKARAFGNETLEIAKGLTYEAANANTFPAGATYSPCGSGCRETNSLAVPGFEGLSAGATYKASKQFLAQPATAPSSSTASFANSTTDQGLLKVTVTVRWDGTKTYSTSGVVSE